MRKMSLIFLVIVVLGTTLFFFLPYVFKDRVNSRIENYFDKLDVEIAYTTRLGLGRSLSSISFQLIDLTVISKSSTENDTLAIAGKVDLIVDIFSLFNNLNEFEVKKIEVLGGSIFLKETTGGNETVIRDLDMVVQGKKDDDIIPLNLEMEAGSFSLIKDGETYINEAGLKVQMDAELLLPERRMFFKENNILLNDIEMSASGWVGLNGTDIESDMSLMADSQDLSVFLSSLLPSFFPYEYSSEGLVKVLLQIKREYSENNSSRDEINLDLEFGDSEFLFWDSAGSKSSVGLRGNMEISPVKDSLTIKANLEKLIYNNFGAEQLNGKILLFDNRIIFDSISAQLFKGSLLMNGNVDMSDRMNSILSAVMEFRDIDIDIAIRELETMKLFLPTKGELGGQVDMKIDFYCGINSSMNIDPYSITGRGEIKSDSIYTEESIAFGNIKRVMGLGDEYRSTFHNLDIIFSISSGNMYVEPFETRVGNLKMIVGGEHGLDNHLDYLVRTEMPRDDISGPVNSLISLFSGSMSALGISVPNEDVMKMDIKITGLFGKPVITPLF